MKDKYMIENQHYRYERKFILPSILKDHLELIIYKNQGRFRQVYSERLVNNIYFDTCNYDFYYQNIEGDANRNKIRLRWYGNIFGSIKSTIEVKVKKGLVGTKLNYSLPIINLSRTNTVQEFKNTILENIADNLITQEILMTNPVLMNSYVRKYYLSLDKKYRITVDINLKSYNLTHNKLFAHTQNFKSQLTILELKYNNNDNDAANLITSLFPFRLTKFSKYIAGMQSITL